MGRVERAQVEWQAAREADRARRKRGAVGNAERGWRKVTRGS